jgi:hypothetical protein
MSEILTTKNFRLVVHKTFLIAVIEIEKEVTKQQKL